MDEIVYIYKVYVIVLIGCKIRYRHLSARGSQNNMYLISLYFDRYLELSAILYLYRAIPDISPIRYIGSYPCIQHNSRGQNDIIPCVELQTPHFVPIFRLIIQSSCVFEKRHRKNNSRSKLIDEITYSPECSNTNIVKQNYSTSKQPFFTIVNYSIV